MKTKSVYAIAPSLARIVGMIGFALLLVSSSRAQCGRVSTSLAHPVSWRASNREPGLRRASLATNDGQDDEAAKIVWLWHVKFLSDGISEGVPGGVPKGAPIDAGYAQWHKDGTEIMNSGSRAPNTGNFCLGVWKKIGPLRYELNHFGISWDPAKGTSDLAGNPTGELIGPANIHEWVTLSPDGDTFFGTFTIDQFDELGHRLVHLQGAIMGTRISVNTSVESIF